MTVPDELAYLKPNRTELWEFLETHDEPVKVTTMSQHIDWSQPTIYRMLDDLQKYDLVEKQTEITEDGPKVGYVATR